ncbi:MAG: DUF1684 domain-containing protein [Burkholderiales bacterium]|nr:DUF1684 domain-containing protein [Burkholderiales bacterium]
MASNLMHRLPAAVAALLLAGLALAASGPDRAYQEELAKWRTKADASLTRERGWLSMVSRDELGPGTWTIGSAPDSHIVLPKALSPAHLGTITAGGDKARLTLAKGQTMRPVDNPDDTEPFTSRDLVTGGTRVEWVTSGRLSLQFVKREDGKIVVRAADRDSPRRRSFAGRVWFSPTAEFKVPARFVARAEGATIPIANVRGEISYEKVAGTLEFTVNGQKMSLDALDDDRALFIIFRDATSNASITYPSGRFLAVEKPRDGGAWTIDFNRAYNPPCAFSAYTTCPLPPPQNWLKGEISAGEKYAGRKS